VQRSELLGLEVAVPGSVFIFPQSIPASLNCAPHAVNVKRIDSLLPLIVKYFVVYYCSTYYKAVRLGGGGVVKLFAWGEGDSVTVLHEAFTLRSSDSWVFGTLVPSDLRNPGVTLPLDPRTLGCSKPWFYCTLESSESWFYGFVVLWFIVPLDLRTLQVLLAPWVLRSVCLLLQDLVQSCLGSPSLPLLLQVEEGEGGGGFSGGPGVPAEAEGGSQGSLDTQRDEADFLHAVNEKLRDAPLSTQSRDALEKAAAESAVAATVASSRTGLARVHTLGVEKNDKAGTSRLRKEIASTSAKASFTVHYLHFTGEEDERKLRKLFFAASVDIADQSMSIIAQPLVYIALKLLQILRQHRAAHGCVGPYTPPHVAVQDDWMANDDDLVAAVEDLEAEFTTQNLKDKFDAMTGPRSVGNGSKRVRKRYSLLKRANSLMCDGLLEVVKGKTLLMMMMIVYWYSIQ
jgi:hypothetical protein